jgi:hypothetical protein
VRQPLSVLRFSIRADEHKQTRAKAVALTSSRRPIMSAEKRHGKGALPDLNKGCVRVVLLYYHRAGGGQRDIRHVRSWQLVLQASPRAFDGRLWATGLKPSHTSRPAMNSSPVTSHVYANGVLRRCTNSTKVSEEDYLPLVLAR